MTDQTVGAIFVTSTVAVLTVLVFSIIFGFWGQFLLGLLIVGVLSLLIGMWVSAYRAEVKARNDKAARGA